MTEAAAWNRDPIVRPMRLANVPTVDARYWTAITLASIFGCNVGDCVSFYRNWNHWIGLFPLAVVFAILLFGERHSTRATQAWYWTVVIVLRAAATNLADLATHTFEWRYPIVIMGLAVVQVLVLAPVSPRLLDSATDRTGQPATTAWYWASLLVAGTLGTAVGDWMAEGLHLGTGYGTLLLGAMFAVVLALGWHSRWTTKAGYWLAIIAVRSAGTTAGDWLAFRDDPGLSNGLNLGLPVSTAITGVLFIAILVLWKTRTAQSAAKQSITVVGGHNLHSDS